MQKYTKNERQKMKEFIYVASPYNHPDAEVVKLNFRFITNEVAKRVAKGEILFSPITYGHTLLEYQDMPSSWKFWQEFCLSFLQKADRLVVYKMNGWEASRGVQDEIEFAKKHSIPIDYIEVTE